jgi:hypothetical protein
VTPDESPNPEPETKPPKLQFSLLAIFWLVTVVAIFCSIGSTLAPHWQYLRHQGIALAIFIFWPLAALPVVITCPANRFIRCIVFASFGLGAILGSFYSLPNARPLSTVEWLFFPIVLAAGLLFWAIETVTILGIIDYFRRRGTKDVT